MQGSVTDYSPGAISWNKLFEITSIYLQETKTNSINSVSLIKSLKEFITDVRNY